MKYVLVALCVLVAAPVAAQRPMSEMQGDCTNYATKLDREFGLWSGPSGRIVAAPAAGNDAPAIAVDHKYDIKLARHDAVKFAAPPEQDRGGPDRFSGIGRLVVPANGSYRVSASNGLWIDIVDGDRITRSSAFEMQTKCATIFKTVTYKLESGPLYWLQLNGSRSDSVGLLVTRAP